MAQTTLNVRMDADVKRALDEFCVSVGMNTSVAINMFAKAVLREQRLPFEVVADPFYSSTNMKRLKKSIEQMNNTPLIRKTMEELEAMESE